MQLSGSAVASWLSGNPEAGNSALVSCYEEEAIRGSERWGQEVAVGVVDH